MKDKLTRILDNEGNFSGQLMFQCPGCGHCHAPNVLPDKGMPTWGWNGSMDKPTFTPSILSRWPEGDPPVTPDNYKEYKKNPWPQNTVNKVCHSYVTDGKIQFLGDCTHELAGQTAEIPDWED